MTDEMNDPFVSIGLAAWLTLKRVHLDRRANATRALAGSLQATDPQRELFGGTPERSRDAMNIPAQVDRSDIQTTVSGVENSPNNVGIPQRQTIRRGA